MENDERKPVRDLETLASLDERDMLSGYWAGFKGDGNEPGIEFNRSFWHGWRNGMADSRRLDVDASQAELARLIVESHKRS